MKALSPMCKTTGKQIRKEFTEKMHYINSLPIKDEYKALFLEVTKRRGLQDLSKLKDSMIAISDGSCEVTRLFLVQKLIGIELLHFIVENADKKKRVDVYEAIKKGGVKASREEVEKLIGVPLIPRLL